MYVKWKVEADGRKAGAVESCPEPRAKRLYDAGKAEPCGKDGTPTKVVWKKTKPDKGKEMFEEPKKEAKPYGKPEHKDENELFDVKAEEEAKAKKVLERGSDVTVKSARGRGK